jgi:hypothetical protein
MCVSPLGTAICVCRCVVHVWLAFYAVKSTVEDKAKVRSRRCLASCTDSWTQNQQQSEL